MKLLFEAGSRYRAAQFSLIAGLAFFVLLPMMKRTLTISLDFDWFWRVVLFRAGKFVFDVSGKIRGALDVDAASLGKRATALAERYLGRPDKERRPGVLARAWSIGITATWIAVLLTAYLGVYYF